MNKNVPYWYQLPDESRKLLSSRHYHKDWFNEQEDTIRLTVLDLFVKLRGMDLWQYVLTKDSTELGRLHFLADVSKLKRELTTRWNFRSPEDSMKKWDSAEKRATGALHFKHFDAPDWPENKVQAHIDQGGVWVGNRGFWWIGVPVTGLRHLASYNSYQDVFGIREILLEQGWDPETLLGVDVGDFRMPDPRVRMA